LGRREGLTWATTDIGLIGRDSELSRLSRLVDPPPTGSHVHVLLGEPGMGKTVLLAEATRRAGAAGLRVLAVTGRESERDLAFAGLHQVLRPVLDDVPTLPDRQAQARRQRRINDAKPVLAAALETLRRLDAAACTRRAEAELRACGVTTQIPSTAPDPLAGLTAQQRGIVILASHGHHQQRDRRPPVPVSPHRRFPPVPRLPELGIAGRHQLRDLINQTSGSFTPPGGGGSDTRGAEPDAR
jgi:hypothetical protein